MQCNEGIAFPLFNVMGRITVGIHASLWLTGEFLFLSFSEATAMRTDFRGIGRIDHCNLYSIDFGLIFQSFLSLSLCPGMKPAVYILRFLHPFRHPYQIFQLKLFQAFLLKYRANLSIDKGFQSSSNLLQLFSYSFLPRCFDLRRCFALFFQKSSFGFIRMAILPFFLNTV